MIWQGISFPDGMLVIGGPTATYAADTMVWRDSVIRLDLNNIDWPKIRQEEI
jgi:hypothetical protein